MQNKTKPEDWQLGDYIINKKQLVKIAELTDKGIETFPNRDGYNFHYLHDEIDNIINIDAERRALEEKIEYWKTLFKGRQKYIDEANEIIKKQRAELAVKNDEKSN